MDNKIVGIMLSIVIGLIMIGSVLSPIITSARGDFGDPVSYAQDGSRTPYFMGLVPDDETVTAEVVEGGILVNGVPYSATITSAATWSPIISTDTGYLAMRNESSAARVSIFTEGEEITSNSLAVGDTVTFVNGTCTISGSINSTFEYTVCYSVGFEDDLVMLIDMGTRYSGRYGLVNDIKDITIYSYYSSGNNDTFYTFVDGKLSVGGDYESSVNYDLQLKDGTTDIYEIHEFTVTIGGETFVPYFAFVPAVVEGHADSGAAYGLIGIIPIIVIVVLLFMAVGALFRSRY